MAAGPATDFDLAGYSVVADVVSPETIEALDLAIDRAGDGEAILRREGTLYGMRDAFREVPEVARLARSERLLDLLCPILGAGAFPVRALLFDKTPGANWGVPWHQDLTIAVKARVETPGFGPWTVKAGIDHVRPPVSVLERMVTIRVHLDDSDGERGPLRVLPGSHRDGRLGAEETRGGVVMIRPLLLHASSPADSPTRRRVVHLEYAAEPLTGGLEWFETNDEGPR
jgi:ectoine hydroxylase-related dioxygenase (phytanoyl-CoA dioxygenase family)